MEKALDGLPIPGAKGAIGGLLEVIKGVEVSLFIVFSLCDLNRGMALKKANENAEALKGLEAHLTELTGAILVPLKGKKETDVSLELRERIEKLLG